MTRAGYRRAVYEPGSEPTGYQQTGVWYPPPPPTRRVSPLRVALASALLVLVLLSGAGLLLAAPVLDEYPATMTAPDQVAGMHQLNDPRLNEITNNIVANVLAPQHLDSMMAAFYLPSGASSTKLLLVGGGTRFNLRPGGQARDSFAAIQRDGATVTQAAEVDPGPMGGAARCASTKISKVPVPIAVCVWVDYGSFGIVMAFDRTVGDAANLMVLIRPEVLHRG